MENPSEAPVELSAQEQNERMREGVDALFVLWAALDMMKDAQSAGWDTENAIDDMYEGIMEQFVFSPKPKVKVSQLDLEDMIFDFCSHDLHTVLEDGSVEQIADYCGQIFRGLCRHDLTVYSKVMLAASKKRKNPPKKTVVIEEESDEDEEEGDHEHEDDEDEEEAKEKDDGANDNNDDDDGAVQDDGWEVVGQKKSKAKGKGKSKKSTPKK